MKQKEWFFIVLTGGPCSGKTTGLARLKQKFEEYGFEVYIIPETATDFFNRGVKLSTVCKDPETAYLFQKQVFLEQIRREDSTKELASLSPAKKKVFLLDRGCKDGEAYMESEDFKRLVAECGYDIHKLQDRYHAICHLVTAANGAEEFYNLENKARYESLEEARAVEERILKAWLGHDHLSIIPNICDHADGTGNINFEQKMDILTKAVCGTVGIPTPIEIERKYLIPIDFDLAELPKETVAIEIKQDYLVSNDPHVERRVRKRWHKGTDSSSHNAVHIYTEKRNLSPTTRFEEERIISAREYNQLITNERDPQCQTIIKTRHAFIFRHQYFMLDVFREPKPVVILEIELTEEQQFVSMPPYLHSLKEVTDLETFRNRAIAAGLCPGYTSTGKPT